MNTWLIGIFALVIGILFCILGLLMFCLHSEMAVVYVREQRARLPVIEGSECVDFGKSYLKQISAEDDEHHNMIKHFYPEKSVQPVQDNIHERDEEDFQLEETHKMMEQNLVTTKAYGEMH